MFRKLQLWTKRHCTANAVSLIFTLGGLISSIVTLSYFAGELSSHQQYNYVYAYHPSICNLQRGYAQAVACLAPDDQPLPKWISVLVDEQGRTCVENPFALRSSRLHAIDDRSRSDFFTNLTCRCLLSNSEQTNLTFRACSVWPTCILDSDFLTYIQETTTRAEKTYLSFIVASSISILLSLLGLPSTLILIIRRCKAESQDYIEL